MFTHTFYRYISRQYFLAFLAFLMIMLSIIFMFDLIELIRRGSSRDLPFSLILQMALLKAPEVGQKLFPFAVLFSAIFTFWRLTKSNELIVARAAGFSAWQFLMPVIGVALLIGVVKTAVINPASSILIAKFERMENKYINTNRSLVDLTENGLWLKQVINDSRYIVIHSEKFDPRSFKMEQIVMMELENNNLLQRYDISSATLQNGTLYFSNAVLNDFNNPPQNIDQFTLATTITKDQIQDSFASPDTISFWKLPAFIESMDALGFPSTKLRIYMQSLLSDPLLYIAMVLLAATVSLRPPRRGGVMIMITSGVMIGFIVFIIDNFLQAYGLSEQIPPFVASWSAPVITFVFGLAVLMYQEENA